MKVLLVDDEKPARARLARLLQEFPDVVVVGEATNGQEALERIMALRPDVVFLDIEMPGLTGLEVARVLPASGPKVVFATAYDEFALQAFDANAVDYLVKPIEVERLRKTMERLTDRSRKPDLAALAAAVDLLDRAPKSSKLAVRVGAKFLVFDVAKISALCATDHYVEVLCGEHRALADDSLDALERRLDPQKFARIHRGAIVNLDFLKELRREGDRKYVAVLNDYFESELPVSREGLAPLKERLGIS